jgi:hypothetical protein
MESRKQRLLGRCHPPFAQRAAHNFHDVIMVEHAQCIWGGACVGMLRGSTEVGDCVFAPKQVWEAQQSLHGQG